MACRLDPFFNALDGATKIFVDYNSDPAYLALARARYSQMSPIGGDPSRRAR